MSARVAKWTGGALLAAAVLWIGIAMIGLDRADKLASVIGALTGIAGLALAVYGTIISRRAAQAGEPSEHVPGPPSEQPSTSLPEPAFASPSEPPPGPPSESAFEKGAGSLRSYEISGGVFHGPVFQGGDFDRIDLGTPATLRQAGRPTAPPEQPESPAQGDR